MLQLNEDHEINNLTIKNFYLTVSNYITRYSSFLLLSLKQFRHILKNFNHHVPPKHIVISRATYKNVVNFKKIYFLHFQLSIFIQLLNIRGLYITMNIRILLFVTSLCYHNYHRKHLQIRILLYKMTKRFKHKSILNILSNDQSIYLIHYISISFQGNS